MPIDPWFGVLLVAGVFCGALVSAFAGFAFSPVAGIFLVAFLAPTELIPLLMICSVLVQVAGLLWLRQSIQRGRSDAMIWGGTLGVAGAVTVLPLIDVTVFRIGFGVFLAGYALAMLRRRVAAVAGPRCARGEAATGLLGGLVGGLTAMPGAVPVLYCDLKGLPKAEQRAVVQPFILVMQVLALALLAAGPGIGADVLWLAAYAFPALAAGMLVGLQLYGRAPEAGFRRSVLVLLLVSGLGTAGGGNLLVAMF